MKKNLFRSLMVSLFVFTLFISVSNAAINANTTYSIGAVQTSKTNKNVSDVFPEHTEESLINLLKDFRNNPTDTTFSAIYDLFASLDSSYNYVYSNINHNNNKVSFYAYSDEESDFGIGLNSDGILDRLIFLPDETSHLRYYLDLSSDDILTFRTERINSSYPCGHLLVASYYTVFFRLPAPVKQMLSVSSTSYKWDGVSYYTQPSPEPEEPDFEGISDDEKALIINSVVNLNDFKNIVPKKYRNQYFIVYEPSIQRFKVYFYPEQYYLKGRRFAEGEVDDISYESYKIIAFDSTNFIWDLWQSINPFDYYVFSGFLEEDNVFAPQFYGYENSHDLNQYYFSVYDEPIVYSSRDIGFVIYDITNNEYSDDAENSIITAPLVDSSGEEITITIPEEEGPESIGFWDSFLLKLKTLFTDLFSYLGATIEFLLNKLFDLPAYLLEQYGENVFTLLFAIIVKALEVLVSSISLLFRFASFLLTLVAIPADSTLFNVAVDGSAWGTNFIKGLDFLKGLSWNNLNFWRLFEWFVASLEVIWTVRIVRRHYSSIM